MKTYEDAKHEDEFWFDEPRPMYRLSDHKVFVCLGCGAMVMEEDRGKHKRWHITVNDWFGVLDGVRHRTE